MNLYTPIVVTAGQASPEAIYQQALAAWRQGNASAAANLATQAIEASPCRAPYYDLLGLCYGQLGRPEDAVIAFRQALRLHPNYTDAGINLSIMLANLGHMTEAERVARETSDRDPYHVTALCNYGVALARHRKANEAKAIFLRVIKLQPDNVSGQRNYAHTCRETGQFDAALEAYQAVLRLNPRDGQSHEKLSQMRRHTKADLPACRALEAILMDTALPKIDRICLHFALGKMFDDMGDFDAAFHHFKKANDNVPVKFDRAKHTQYIEKLMAYFTPERFAHYRDVGNPSDQPIFIVGMPRSGTTLTEQILSRHPLAFGAGELPDIAVLMKQLVEGPSAFAKPPLLESLSANEIRGHADQYLKRRLSQCETAVRYLDKLPDNFLYLGLIAILFPHARIIHCRRDPLDIGVSCFTSHFASRVDFAQNLGDIGFFYRKYEQLMNHWRKVLPLSILDVHYEEIVADQANSTKRLLEFCDLDWDDRCLEFHKNTRPISTVSDWQVRQPLYSTSVGRWRKFAAHLGPLQDELAKTESNPVAR